MCKEKCLPAVGVRIIIESIFINVLCSLIFVCNPTVHYVYVSGPSLYYMCPFFIQIILILAKHVVVIAQFLELQHVCLAWKLISFINTDCQSRQLPLIFSMGGINTANDSPHNFL
jgi:hypothetical protein